MNKETKVGLLVGLALIVLVGAILSNYLSRPSQDQAAGGLNTIDQQLRQGFSDSDTVPPPPDMSPQQPPLTTSANSSGSSAASTGSTGQTAGQNPPAPGARQQNPAPNPAAAGASNTQGTVAQNPSAQSSSTLNLPLNLPQTTMVADDSGTPINGAPDNNAPQIHTASASNVYTVVAGDTLSRIARKFYHSSGSSVINRILHANASKLSSRESILRVGETLVIPAITATPEAVATAHKSAAPLDTVLIPTDYAASNNFPAPAPEKTSGAIYHVKQGDTLYSIARRFLGSGNKSNITLIMQTNHIQDASSLTIGQTLHIPSR
ncbi:MAG TPA: LysM peptidoglycan-binding domain-containing protein [Phycisphaerae bacterium]|nr:LysM peptidoglycan-binding domain-containing protein [Phycisphaerae bacterium]